MGECKRTALVLGASGTLGCAIAQQLFASGYALGLHGFQHPEKLPQLLTTTSAQKTKAYTADFRIPAHIEKLAQDYLADFGSLHALVCAAGITRDAPVLTQKGEDLREVLAVNLTAPLLLCKHFARTFIKQKSGTVVFVSSHAGLSGRAGGAAYSMAQSGLLALAKSLAREWGSLGVRVNCIVPPFVPESVMGQSASPGFSESVKLKNVLKGPSPNLAMGVAHFVAELLENPTASGQVFTLDARIAG